MMLFAELALLPDGWAHDVTIEIDATNTIVAVREPSTFPLGARRIRGALVPGMPNIHSHAFQRAMAGSAEHRSNDGDDFWSWRTSMYKLAATLDPDALFTIARAAYREMREGGYTSVCEFHYLHRDPRGTWYAEKSAMARALIEAAKDADIAICLLPALYSQAGPDGAPLAPEQRRFATSADDILEMSRDLRAAYAGEPSVTVGICAHSLRAARPDEFRLLLAASPRNVPVHLHIAEQEREVREFEATFAARPIEWLLEHFPVDARWCLVHATCATTTELRGIAKSGATVGLCPTTEANLGDGLFGYVDYTAAGGTFGIGSDSNLELSATAELRLLEYGQRLYHRRRVVAAADGASCGDTLYTSAAAGGGAVCGFPIGSIAPGNRADFVTLAASANDTACLDRSIFAPAQPRFAE